jgi:hypothetical protein
MQWLRTAALAVTVTGTLAATTLNAAEISKHFGPDPKLHQATVDLGIQFLASRQSEDGSVSPQIGIGPTALATFALMRSGRMPPNPQVAKGLKYLEEYVQESGGINAPGSRIPTYETCIALICFQQANADHRYDEILKNAEAFLRRGQWDESRGKAPDDLYYGGAGYGGKSRPDLSNTAYLTDALKACGAGSDDKALQRALVFVSRCQNLESEHNTTKFAGEINDGGFYYTPFQDPPGALGETANGSHAQPSYGAMTYSGLKSMIYAGLTKGDPRVKVAIGWIRKNYDLKSNPGKGDAGLFYYYHTFAKTLDVIGIDEFEDAKGVKHDWRRELTEELARRQKPDGSWVNANNQWMEGDPNLATAFAVLALSYCRK